MNVKPWLMFGLLAAASCAEAPTSELRQANPNPIFETDVVPIFGRSCGSADAGCHRREAFNAVMNQECRGWLSLEAVPLGSVFYAGAGAGTPTGCTDRDLYDRLLTNAWMCGAPTDQNESHVAYVVPCDPEASLLYRVLGPGPLCSRMENYMPIGRKADPLEVQTIYNWIANGAPRLNDPGVNCESGGGATTMPPAAPTMVAAEPLGDGLHVTWTDNSDNEDQFVVERSENGATFEELVALPFDSSSYHDAAIQPDATYSYRIGARNSAGTNYSDSVSTAAR
jgi:hypothetical protein